MTFLLTCAVLCLAIVGVVCDGNARRAWWLGFALFGWGYLLLAFWSSVELPTMALLDAIGQRFDLSVHFSGRMGGMGGGMRSAGLWRAAMFGGFGGFGGASNQSIIQISHCLLALLAALIGGASASFFFGGSKDSANALDRRTPIATPARRRKWLLPTLLGLAACVMLVFLGLFLVRSSPGFWIGSTFLATWVLLGMTVLGAASSHSKGRQIWLGAALFGVGYMTLAFGRARDGETWPSMLTDHLLYALRGWVPPVVSGFPTSSSAVASANAQHLADA